jgi:mannose/cellobiose epimerase-like protein (N-acyl-D-glucosamine 2-epimerase family)
LGFREHLTLDGAPAEISYKRLRVQARQIYVFSHAALLGWPGGVDVARRGYEFIIREALNKNGAWARTLGRNGGVIEDIADLYDLAFVLFAFAWFARASGESESLEYARRTLAWIEDTMAHPAGGYHNTWPIEPGPRLQNPHMHLLEAMLALYQTTRDPQYIIVAKRLVLLFRERLLESSTGTLGEFFTTDLRAAPGEAGDHVEPGHHYEWVWLLDQFSSATGDDTASERNQLYQFAEAHGVDHATGTVYDVVGRDGRVRRASSRLWPQTEAIKAHIAMMRGGHFAAGRRLEAGVRNLLARHFTNCARGAWREQFDHQGLPSADKIPSSSLYHIVMAFGELDGLCTAHY